MISPAIVTGSRMIDRHGWSMKKSKRDATVIAMFCWQVVVFRDEVRTLWTKSANVLELHEVVHLFVFGVSLFMLFTKEEIFII
jgi:hypothetical protein